MQAKLFKKDINALRAIAVLAVVIFHFNPSWIPGGFAGVDVFFVISGFLMTSIIFRDFEQQRFNLFKFYVARVNRIIPALALVCLVLLILGWFYLPPYEYRSLGRHIESSLLFKSNLTYLHEAGYFDAASHEKWLLHTWSLSVEWQFYIIYPAILLILKRFIGLQHLKKVILALFAISLAYCIYKTEVAANAAYYLLQTRAWEMLLGGLAFLYPITLKPRQRQWFQTLGLVMILGAYFIFSNRTPWPGYYAILPIFGAYLIIIANQQQSWFSNNPLFQIIGKWSYSIYLWHWPIVVFGVIFEINQWWVYGIPLSLFLGYLSYQYVESYRFPSYLNWADILKLKPLWLSIIIASLGSWLYKSNGAIWHYSDQVIIASKESNNKNPYKCMQDEEGKKSPLPKCFIGQKGSITAIMIGDSHADAVTTALSANINLQQHAVLALTRASCPFVLNARSNKTDDTCYQENFARIAEAKKYPGIPIFITARWSAYIYGQSDPARIKVGDNRALMYFGDEKYMSEPALLNAFSQNLTQTLCSLTPHSPVYITLPIPEMDRDIPKVLSRHILQHRETALSIDRQHYDQRNSGIRAIIQQAAKTCAATVLDPAEILCPNGKCIAEFNGRPIYYDSDHMSEYGNKLLSPMFKSALVRAESALK
ncbi:peptidoglycan/LPS O-acetylase OafA/YrhL [Acinetobacter calcoaceticus]|uniref:Peptidoglycan/LPS O-acetylase OafA/YrhL n=1 Tax=Acinetobacter calcoaceticus TaxID=471 RepID=A0A4V2R007_ACICA|nr:peptidoglycan/LPS O-acetylase OafA/YrhL [Acinetobacter calcoaceticus]